LVTIVTNGTFLMPLPSQLVECNEIGFNECFKRAMHVLWVGFFTYLGRKACFLQAFVSLFCTLIHFSTLSKCIHLNCSEKMRDSWWSCVRITKPETIMVVEPSMLKTSRPELPNHFIISPKGKFHFFPSWNRLDFIFSFFIISWLGCVDYFTKVHKSMFFKIVSWFFVINIKCIAFWWKLRFEFDFWMHKSLVHFQKWGSCVHRVSKSSTFLVHGCTRIIFLHKGTYYVYISPLSSIETF
jgi:hypothetical protein